MDDYTQYFEKYANDYDGIVHISIGSGFSSCHQNARLAAEEFDNVVCIVSANLSTAGLGRAEGLRAGANLQFFAGD